MKYKKSKELSKNIIIFNKKIYYNFFILEEFEAGLLLQGWEVKSIRAGKLDINNSYVTFRNSEAFLLGANFIPLSFSSTHYLCEPTRARKLLLNQREINLIYGYVNRKKCTIVVKSLYWRRIWCKARICIAKGKKKYDKRLNSKKQEWQKQKSILVRN